MVQQEQTDDDDLAMKLFTSFPFKSFKIIQKTGTAPGGIVYKALQLYTDYHWNIVQNLELRPYDVFFTLRVIDIVNHAEVYRRFRTDRVEEMCREIGHKNLVRYHVIKRTENKLFVQLPYMIGSLESIMFRWFKNGLPEDCIAIALRETLEALSHLHAKGVLHKDIHAGHIFVPLVPENIQLAFSGSIYEEFTGDHGQDSSSSSSPSISAWAAAPEVIKFGEDYYTCKADIWLIGITALQLACGGIGVSNREELDCMIEILMIKPFKLSASWNDWIRPKNQELSKQFWNMVTMCLDQDPTKRPTAQQLLEHKFFKKCKPDPYTAIPFYDVLLPCIDGLVPAATSRKGEKITWFRKFFSRMFNSY